MCNISPGKLCLCMVVVVAAAAKGQVKQLPQIADCEPFPATVMTPDTVVTSPPLAFLHVFIPHMPPSRFSSSLIHPSHCFLLIVSLSAEASTLPNKPELMLKNAGVT